MTAGADIITAGALIAIIIEHFKPTKRKGPNK